MSASKRTIHPTENVETKKAIFLLTDQQIGYLDHAIADIRQTTGTVMKRTAVIRAVIDSLIKSKVDFSTATSETEITAILAKKLKG